MNQQSGLAAGEEIITCASLGSTSGKAWALLEEGRPLPFWVLANQQTEGRGRHGRQWQSAPGNLFTSTARSFRTRPEKTASLSLVVGLAALEAIENAAAKQLDLTLKWPNDILHQQAKIGGILIEAQAAPPRTEDQDQTREGKPQDTTKGGGATIAVIGIGINIVSHPELDDRRAEHLNALGLDLDRDQLLAALIPSVQQRLEQWQQSPSLEEVCKAWLARSEPLNTLITVKIGSEIIEGRFKGLDDHGALLLALPDNSTRTITGGEVL